MFQQDIEIAMTEKKLFLLHVQLYGFHLCWFLVAIVCRKTETYGTNDTTDIKKLPREMQWSGMSLSPVC